MTKCEKSVPPYAEVAPNKLEEGCDAAEKSLEEECSLVLGPLNPVVLNIFGTRYPFCGRQFFYKESREGMVQAVTPVMESTGEQQTKLHSLACHIPPAPQPGS